MVRPGLDWKEQQRNILNWLTILLAAALILVSFSLWGMDGRTHYLLLAVTFLVWLGIYFTDYWQPVLYLVLAVVIVVIVSLWAFEGLWGRPLGPTAIILNTVFLLLIVYLYYYEEVVASPE